jgi:hypothetical protein
LRALAMRKKALEPAPTDDIPLSGSVTMQRHDTPTHRLAASDIA